MPSVVRTIGGAGTGKTTRLLELMEKAAEVGGYSLFDIGFVSFTRAARLEAASRAAEKFGGVKADDLQQLGWFRTLHSCCFRLLQAKQDAAISDTVKDRQWLSEAVGDQVSGADEGAENPFSGRTMADRALSLWSTARNKLSSFQAVHEVAVYCDPRTPDLSYCRNIVEKYEQAKRLDGRYDFTDMTARYAGRSFTFDGPREARAEGEVPEVPVWFLDEQQDTSALLDLVCRRLVSNARWVYMSLDPFQSIYGWSGASAKHAMAWDVQKQDVLNQSYRCPAQVSLLGEKCLRRCSDYWDRGILPAEHNGVIQEHQYESAGWTEMVNPSESWLLLGRTNHVAQRLAKRLEPLNMPWVPTTGGNNRWNAPVRQKVIQAMMNLSMGGAISIPEWKQVLKEVTAKDCFARGTKKQFADRSDNGERKFVGELKDWGATEKFTGLVQKNQWHPLVEFAREYQQAAERWGLAAAFDTQLKIGTIHSVKGAEADNVVIFQTTSEQVHRGKHFKEVADEENRLAYVAVTRAKKRLILLSERDASFQMEIL